MVASLPPNIRLKLEQTLLQWRHWRCDPPLPYQPELVARLGEGLSNYSVLAKAERQFVIRIDGLHVAGNALSRSTEWRGLAMAHSVDLAPCPRYYNPELGALVCDYLAPDDAPTDSIEKVAGLVRAIHNLPALHHRLELRDRIVRYERLAEHHMGRLPDGLKCCRHTALQLVEELTQRNEPQVFCHNDLLSANRIISENKMRAIDWEYCAMGSAWFDLAVIVVGDELQSAQTRALTEAYLQRAATKQELLKLAHYSLVYQYLEILWYLVNTTDGHEIDIRVRKLELRCQQR